MKFTTRRPGPLRRVARIALAVLLVLSHPLWAGTITVDETTCTLVDAVTSANTDTATGGCRAGLGADTIVLTTNVSLSSAASTYNGATGLPFVSSDIKLEGRGFTIERDPDAPAFRLFLVKRYHTLTLQDLTLRNGSAGHGGAIFTRGSVVLTNSTLSNNQASGSGGAIWADCGYNCWGVEVTLTNTTISGNSAGTSGGGIDSDYGEITVTHSVISGNSAGSSGGAIHDYGGYIKVAESTLADNTSGYLGGGITSNSGYLTITNSTLSGNSARRGGGIWFLEYYSEGISLTNSTLSGNTAVVAGGAIYMDYYDSLREVYVNELRNVILTGNEAPLGAGLAGTTRVDLENTIVSNNTGDNCGGLFFHVTDLGGNLADDATCGAGFGPITGVDPELADNGGPTKTHALLPDSSAIDAGGACELTADQRGFPRDDGLCDSGPYEFRCSIAVTRDHVDTLIWFSPDSGEFDVVTGYLSDLLGDEDFSRATCLGSYTASPAVDTLPEPPLGDGRYYLARGLTSCIRAQYGDSSLTPDPRDDLAGGPCP
jgi:predicted outer membrane repeat protein